MRSTLLLLGKIPLYWCFRAFNRPTVLPLNYTIGITYRCNSKCKICNIWKIQHTVPKEMELTLDEWDKVLKHLGKSPYWITITGGEPFLHGDLIEIIGLMERYNKPKIINIPTNGLLYKIIPKNVKEMLKIISPETNLVINFSLDDIGSRHDEIRGVPNNFLCLIKAYKETIKLKNEHDNLTVGVHTVISKWNVHRIKLIYEAVMSELKPDQYIVEVAEERKEMENIGSNITPSYNELEEALCFLINHIKSGRWKGLSWVTEFFRVRYYEMVKNYFGTKKQQIKSYAGFASAQISPIGEVWECAVYATCMGNLRDYNYDFKKLWCSEGAKKVRENVKKSHPCPLANESYTNLLLNPLSTLRFGVKSCRMSGIKLNRS